MFAKSSQGTRQSRHCKGGENRSGVRVSCDPADKFFKAAEGCMSKGIPAVVKEVKPSYSKNLIEHLLCAMP